ncbi:MAG TPA: hypothetical protein VFK02_23400 [Kofleriaceae bacterium]|nr:hypothetical protein [Kofleriaceae bacterium]
MSRWTAAVIACVAGIGLAGVAACHPGQGPAAVHPTPEGREAIARVASRDFAGARAILDEDARTDDGVRTLDPSQVRAGEGRVERFHLIARGDRCLLVHDRTDRTYDLDAAACAAR